MQLQPDYTSQLNQIAEALNRPALPTWVIAILSTVVGAIQGITVRPLQKWLDGYIDRRQLLKIVYRDIGDKVLSLEDVIQEGEQHPEKFEDHFEQRETFLTADTENHLKGKLDLYMGLREYTAARHMYNEFRGLVEKKYDRHASEVVGLLGRLLDKGSMRANLFRKFLPDGDGDRVVNLAARYASLSVSADPPSDDSPQCN